MTQYMEFEKPLAELEGKAEELRAMARESEDQDMDISEEAAALDAKAAVMLKDLYKSLTPWRKCQVARHPERPHCQDYVKAMFTDFTPLAGDRNFADDHAVIGGLARFNDQPVMVIGHEKGNDTKSRIERNFGMARPEGYRKAARLLDLADRFKLPVITLVDTAGAYPGKGAEGCASILWKDAEKMREAAEALRLTAQDLKQLGVTDRIIPEPLGGAHRNWSATIEAVSAEISSMLKELSGKDAKALITDRRQKFLDLGSKGLAA
jgi:acetyl-CoA carboxylase carboxyl transferase subunit alpha